MGEKLCTKCNVAKDDRLYERYPGTDKTRPVCRTCRNEERQQRRANAQAAAASRQIATGHVLQPPPVHVIESVVEAPSRPVVLRPYAMVVAIGDIHFPWENASAVRQAIALVKEIQPEYIIQMGDLYDMYSFSKYPRSYNLMTPQAEEQHGRMKAEDYWRAMQKAAPWAKCFQLWGNHDARPVRRVLELLPEAEHVVKDHLRKLMSFPGVTLMASEEQELVVDGVHYQHSYLSKVGDTMLQTNLTCCTAHLHRGGVVFRGYEGRVIWELGTGWLGDRRSPVLTYAGRRRAHGTTLGIGVIDSYGPRFVPFVEE